MADEKKSIKDQIKERLENGESISQTDLADFNPKEEVEMEEEAPPEVEPSPEDNLTQAGADPQPYQHVAAKQGKASEFGGYNLGLMDMEPAEITRADKEAFMDCLVDDSRFERSFSLFGGRVKGVFRSRTTAESLAIISEVNRAYSVVKNAMTTEFAATLRHANLAMQVAELDGVVYPIFEEPLKSQYDVDTDDVTEPKWWKLVNKYNNMPEGKEQALYTALLEFERVYWTMVKHAGDQNFWNPEDSSTD